MNVDPLVKVERLKIFQVRSERIDMGNVGGLFAFHGRDQHLV